MSLSLKHIPCPAGRSCTAFLCIFGHREPKADSEAVVPRPAPTARDSSPSIDGAPRKRIKVDESGASTASVTSEETNSKNDQGRPNIMPRTATRTVSPPPLGRAAPAKTTKPALSPRQPPASSVSKTSTASAAGSVTKVAVKSSGGNPGTRKPESLNPRLLKSSPASHETRLKLLKMLHAEFTRLNNELKAEGASKTTELIISAQDLILRALDEEQTTALEKPAVYANIMKNKVTQHRRMNVSQWKEERIRETKTTTQEVQGGVKPSQVETGLSSTQEVRFLQRLVTKIDSLSSYGYVASVPAEEAVAKARRGVEAAQGWETCDRCLQRFQVFPGRREEDGALTSGGECRFHWGKTYIPAKQPGDLSRVPKRYQCCEQEVGDSAGCFTHDKHVFKVNDAKRLAAVLNYAATPENAGVPSDRAVCFDCEMGYTVHGMELIRLTATAWPGGEELLDVLVQPIGEILDLNSRFSGVRPDDLADAPSWTPTDTDAACSESKPGAASKSNESKVKQLRKVASPEVARDLLFSLLAPSTPLIGHGLENDLNAVRIVHPTLIDTILLYPHKLGLPYRNSLKMLMSVHLQRKIQQETGPKALGHDSAEDARAAGELVRLKVMNDWKDMQKTGWKLLDGEFIAPETPQGKLTEAFIEAQKSPEAEADS